MSAKATPTDQTVTSDSFTEALMTVVDLAGETPYWEFWEFKAYLQLLKVLGGVIIIIGIVGNLLTLVVLNGPYYRSSPSTVVFSALAVSDLGYVICGLGRQWIIGLSNFSLDIRNLNVVSCKLHTGLTYFFKHASTCSLVLLTVERTLSVLFPLRCKELITKKKMLLYLAFILVSLAALNWFNLYYITLDKTARIPCTIHDEGSWLRDNVSYWVDALLSNILPFFVIAVGNCIMVVKLTMAQKKRMIEMLVQSDDKKTSSTTTMLIAVGFAFLVLTTPKAIYYFGVGYYWWPYKSNQEWARIYLAYIITTLLNFLNSAINFVLYCATGTKFRQAFLSTCKGNQKKQHVPFRPTNTKSKCIESGEASVTKSVIEIR